ncbi:MAG: AEC family transporter, partial [Oscillospiraceae bacterium]
RIAPIALLRLLLLPALVFFALRGAINDPVLLGVAVLLTGMPVATNATMLCVQYGGNDELASVGVFLTTLLSVGTIPLLFSLLLS